MLLRPPLEPGQDPARQVAVHEPVEPPASPGIDLRSLAGMLRRQLKTIVAAALTFLVLSLILIFLLGERYQAAALVEVEVDDGNAALAGPSAQSFYSASYNSRVDSEAAIIASSSVALTAIESLDLWRDDEFGLRPSLAENILGYLGIKARPVPRSYAGLTGSERYELVDRLSKAVDVDRQGLTDVIEVGVTARSPVNAARIANALVKAYLDLQTEHQIQSAKRAAVFLQGRIDQLGAAIRNREEEIRKLVADQLAITPQARAAIDNLNQDLSSLSGQRSLYDTYVASLGEAEQRIALTLPGSRMIAQAVEPNKPRFPGPKLLAAGALLLATTLGCAAALMRENYMGGFTAREQLEAFSGAAVLTSLPRHPEPPHDAIVRSPMSEYAEQIRRLRLGSEDLLDPDKSAVVLLTSSVRCEGKSTIAVSLARAFAQSGRRTLLIDADLRNPSLAALFGREHAARSVDTGVPGPDAAWQLDHAWRDEATGLDLLFGVAAPVAGGDLILGAPGFRKMMATASQAYQRVIIDCSPVGLFVDPLVLLPAVDLVLYVVRYAATGQRTVIQGIAEITNSRNFRQLAAVLNMSPGIGIRSPAGSQT